VPIQPLGNIFDIVEGFPVVDLQTGANNGDYISLKNNRGVLVVFASGIGTAGDDPTITLQQATDNSGTSVKALNFTTIYRKQAATSLASTTAWTETTQSAANTYTNATSAEESSIWTVWVDGADLDVDNSFDHLRATVADVGSNAQPGYLLYIPLPKDPRNPDKVVSYL
jgi:hypothetical protein